MFQLKNKEQKIKDRLEKENAIHARTLLKLETKLKEQQLEQKIKKGVEPLPKVELKRGRPKKDVIPTIPILETPEIVDDEQKEVKTKKPKPKGIIKKFKQFWIRRHHSEKEWLINMELHNGKFDIFIIKIAPTEKSFKYYGKRYIIDEDYKYWVESYSIYALDYHQDLTIPIRRRINIKEIKDELAETADITYSLSPDVVEEYQKNSLAKMLLSASDFLKLINRIWIVALIILIVLIALTLLFMYKTGMFAQVQQMASGATGK